MSKKFFLILKYLCIMLVCFVPYIHTSDFNRKKRKRSSIQKNTDSRLTKKTKKNSLAFDLFDNTKKSIDPKLRLKLFNTVAEYQEFISLWRDLEEDSDRGLSLNAFYVACYACCSENIDLIRNIYKELVALKISKMRLYQLMNLEDNTLIIHELIECGDVEILKILLEMCPQEKLFNFLMETKTSYLPPFFFALKKGVVNDNIKPIIQLFIDSFSLDELFKVLSYKSYKAFKALGMGDSFKGLTLIHFAIISDKIDFIKTTLEKFDSLKRYKLISLKNDTGFSAFHYAIYSTSTKIIEEIYNQCPIDKRTELFFKINQLGHTSLHMAVLLDHKEKIDMLLKLCPENKAYEYLSKPDIEGFSVLATAIKKENKEIVDKLLMKCPQKKQCHLIFSWDQSNCIDCLSIALKGNQRLIIETLFHAIIASVTKREKMDRELAMKACTALKANFDKIYAKTLLEIELTTKLQKGQQAVNTLRATIQNNNALSKELLRLKRERPIDYQRITANQQFFKLIRDNLRITEQLRNNEVNAQLDQEQQITTRLMERSQERKGLLAVRLGKIHKTFSFLFSYCIFKKGIVKSNFSHTQKITLIKQLEDLLKYNMNAQVPIILKDFFAVVTNQKPSDTKYEKKYIDPCYYATPTGLSFNITAQKFARTIFKPKSQEVTKTHAKMLQSLNNSHGDVDIYVNNLG